MPGEEIQLRISDTERNAVIDQLRDHTADGRLTLTEFDDRVGEVYRAKTAPELRYALRELPVQTPAPDFKRLYRLKVRDKLASWVGVNGICVGIWVADSPHGEFWPIWPLLFTTVGLVGLLIRGSEAEAERERNERGKRELQEHHDDRDDDD